jgi:hypothetical protein
MARIAYIDHSYHSKTGSTQFLPEILRRRGHTVDFFWDDVWKGGTAVPFSRAADYDVVIMFQCRCESQEPYFRKLHPNVVYIPMLDSFEIYRGPQHHRGWEWEPFQGCKILSFSSALHAIATSFGLRSFFIRYYQPPENRVPHADLPSAFFWLRHENHVSWPMVRSLLQGTCFGSVHLHVALDPYSLEPTLPTEAERKEYNITTSTWFAEKSDFLNIVKCANIFFAPRLDEGIGQSFLEAMARGQCVAAPDNGTMNEYILHGVNGLLYNPERPTPLDFSRFAELGEAARQSVAAGYERWLAAEDRLEEFILMPSSKAYKGLYQHVPFRQEEAMEDVAPTPLTLRKWIRKLALIKKTERFWMPVWRLLKKIKNRNRPCFDNTVSGGDVGGKPCPELHVPDAAPQCNVPAPCNIPAPPCNIPIITSIAPKRIEEQKKAISTWLAQGFTPVSVNYEDEIENLKESFPSVQFLPARTDSLPSLGKKRIFINDLLFHVAAYTQQNNCRFAGIVNSDVLLYNIDVDLLAGHAAESLVFSRRNDVETHEHSEGAPYNNGFDAFFFGGELLRDFPQCLFALGEPWWDIAVPLWSILHDKPIVACSPPLCRHVIHETNWHVESWESLGKLAYDMFEPLLMRKRPLFPRLPETLHTVRTNSLPPAEFMLEFAEFVTSIVNSVPNTVNFVLKNK